MLEEVMRSGTWVFPYSKVVFIGDYLDSFSHSTASLLYNFRQILSFKKAFPDNVVMLLGNHEWHYVITGAMYSGYRYDMAYQVKEELNAAIDAGLIQLTHSYYDGVDEFTGKKNITVASHAGITKSFLKDSAWYMERFVKEELVTHITADSTPQQIDEYFSLMLSSRISVIGLAGFTSGGGHKTGSLLWARPEDMAANAPTYIRTQIVGHTWVPKIVSIDPYDAILDNVESEVILIDALPEIDKDIYNEELFSDYFLIKEVEVSKLLNQ
jgi:hypothetical protein